MKWSLMNGTDEHRERLLDAIKELEYQRQLPYRQSRTIPYQHIYTVANTMQYATDLDQCIMLQQEWVSEVPEFITDIVMDEALPDKVLNAMAYGVHLNGHKGYLDAFDCDCAFLVGEGVPRINRLKERLYKRNNVDVIDIRSVHDQASYIMDTILGKAVPGSYQDSR
ncbi:MAG: hypothetical protein ACQESG_03970 [Nanobdellota archaeon]